MGEYVQTCVTFSGEVCTETAWILFYPPASITDPAIQSLLLAMLGAWAACASLRLLVKAV